MRTDDSRKDFEKEFHDDYITQDREVRKSQSHFYAKETTDYEYGPVFAFLGDIRGKKLLFYGSGGSFSLVKKFTDMGANVVAIDISPKTILQLNTQIRKQGLSDKAVALEMDCEALDFEPGSFDVVFGRSIIHHLDVEKSLQEIYNVMKPGAKVSIIEPLGTNPFISLYRKLTPEDRTPYEHPLKTTDLLLFRNLFKKTGFRYLYVLTLLSFFIRMVSDNPRFFTGTFHVFHKVDNILLRILPFYKFLCWDVIVNCEK